MRPSLLIESPEGTLHANEDAERGDEEQIKDPSEEWHVFSHYLRHVLGVRAVHRTTPAAGAGLLSAQALLQPSKARCGTQQRPAGRRLGPGMPRE